VRRQHLLGTVACDGRHDHRPCRLNVQACALSTPPLPKLKGRGSAHVFGSCGVSVGMSRAPANRP
jgi:hypothetical protein